MKHHSATVPLTAFLIAAAMLAASSFAAAPTAGLAPASTRMEVRVPNFAFDPLVDGEPLLDQEQLLLNRGKSFRLVQFRGPTRNDWLDRLQATGVKVLQYYPHFTYLVWGTEEEVLKARGLDFVRWTGDFHYAYRVSDNLEGRHGVVQNVNVFFFNDGDIDHTVAELERLGANVLQAYPAQPDRTFYVAVVELDAAAFETTSRLNTALWLGYSHPEPMLDDEMAAQIVAGNHIAGVPFTGYFDHLVDLGVTGAGVRWATVDTGVDYNHPDLGPRIVAGYSFPGSCSPAGQDCTNGGHGTHVTGIIGGDATAGYSDAAGFLYGLGIAPGYDIVALNSLSGSAWPPTGGWQEHSKQAVLLNAIGANNSWHTGEGTAHGYQASERTHDFTVLNGNFDSAEIEPFIQVFSAGNSGPGASTLTAPKEGKNLIVVASSRNYRVGSINDISGFSSRGPAVDGRIVPTVAAPGEQIASSRSSLGGSCTTAISGTNNMYAYCSGTSMAAPQVAGAITLATEWWRGFNAGADPSPAMAKALLVNSAVQMGTAAIPNNAQGWGRIDVTRMIDPDVHMVYWDQEHIFTESGQQWIISVGVPDPSKPLKITLAWSDAPGAVGANPALVNNLNLTVINGANTYLGNVFSGGWSAAGGSSDTLNNLENVYIQNPDGSATIIIDAVNIAGDAVLGNADTTDQHFALICRNCALNPDFTLSGGPTNQAICAPNDAVFNVNVGSIMGYEDPVTLSAGGNPAGTTAVFSVNPVTPAGTSILTIGNTATAAPGAYAITVSGTSTTGSKNFIVGLDLFSAVPAAVNLTSPANGALNVPAVPTFTWSAVAQAATYSIQVARDTGFSDVVASATGLTDTTWTSNVTLNTSTTHYWRVRAENACGTGSFSASWNFTTVAAPGDCGPGTTANILYEYGFESGAAGWTSSGTGNTWALSDANPFSGAWHYHANNPTTVSDQRLASPPVVLPVDQNPIVLKFWHAPNLELRSAGGCWDGGILEITTDGGTTWTQVPDANLLVGGYTGTIASGYSNPLAGLQGWCGSNPQPYYQTIADVSAYAGQTVQFRLRLGSDSTVGRPGWDVDDVLVQSCELDSGPRISLVKTVGTEEGVCAASSNISVPVGTTVYYCYTVTNTGDETLNLHDLEDDQLGEIFTGLVYELAPGASVDTITAGVPVSTVINATVTNQATWTASNTGDSPVFATASATVTATGIELSVILAGTGDGTVTSVPPGINCGDTCSAGFDHGTVVTLSQQAAPGNQFAGWSGACTGMGACQVTMDEAKTVTATFEIASHTLTVIKTGTGSGTVTSAPAGIDCGDTCSASFNNGTVVTLSQQAAVGSVFAGWSGACTGMDACEVTMTQARSVTATFNIPTHTLTVTKAGTGSGTVTSEPAGIDCGDTCAALFNQGQVVTLTTDPAPETVFEGWSGACTGTDACEVTMTEALAVTATFTQGVLPLEAAVIRIDPEAGAGSNGNLILEPGETVVFHPAWHNPGLLARAATGNLAPALGPGGSLIQVLETTADYGDIPGGETRDSREQTGDSYTLYLPIPAQRPATHWHVEVVETLSTGQMRTWRIHVGGSFVDVGVDHWAYPFIETLLHSEITAGCSANEYCPAAFVTRWQMAVFLAKALVADESLLPDSGTIPGLGDFTCGVGGQSVFADIPADDPACRHIHYIAAEGITVGCGGGLYCPADQVTRWQMAVFLAKSLVENEEDLPAEGTIPGMGEFACGAGGQSVFSDVPPEDPACRHIHFMAAEDITAGCGGGMYCPAHNLSRDQMAVFLVKAFHLSLY